jgi:hypothetical protein
LFAAQAAMGVSEAAEHRQRRAKRRTKMDLSAGGKSGSYTPT